MAKGEKPKSETELLQEISHKLDTLIGTLAIQGKEPREQVGILTKLGLTGPEIGTLIGKTANAVRLLRLKRGK